MPTLHEDAPVLEIQRCALGCADWLRAEGYVKADNPGGSTGPDVLYGVNERVNDALLARTVFAIYAWLWTDVLPPIDGRREAERQRVASLPPGEDLPDPSREANLYFGNDEHEVAQGIRDMTASGWRLAPDVVRIAKRQKARALMKNAEDGTRLLRTYAKWVRLGERLVDLVEPSLPSREGLGIPYTKRDWQAARTELEAELHTAGMSDPDISRVLPGGGGADEVYQRRYRSKRR